MGLIKKSARGRKFSMVYMLSFLLILIINLPIITIISRVNFIPNKNWEHLSDYILPGAIVNTFTLVIFTLLLSALIGVLLAVTVTMFDFPLKRFFSWVFYLPITIPPYILAYVYAEMTGYTGIVQKLLRQVGIAKPPQWLDIMNVKGAVFIYALTLYPYIYGAVKSFLENHSGNLIDTARILGNSPVKLILKVILPLIRIPLIGGLMLVMMEVISEYGVVKYFNIQTISYTIFNSWFGMGDTDVAIRLSFYVMIFIIGLQALEELIGGRKRYNLGRTRPITGIKLTGIKALSICIILFCFIFIAFFIPVSQMFIWAVNSYKKVNLTNLSSIISNTLIYSTLATIIILIVNVIIAHSRRWMDKKTGFILSKLTQLGYSIPGAIIAIGTIGIFVSLDGILYPFFSYFDPNVKKLMLTTSVIMLVFAFVVRYMAVGFNSVNSGFAKVGLKYNESARTLGMSRLKAMLKVELPMLKNSLIAGFILTFIDIIKELPLTLLLRPFNYNTIASRAYEYANDERIYEASVPSLIIIFIGIIAVVILGRINSKRKGVEKK